MRRIIKSITLLAIMAIALPSFGQGLKAFKLKNGLSVYVWEDNTKSDVYGIVACRTGSVNDPAEYTGLAHYLEHVMFKGTDKIGALDWATEKPIYDKIIAKYDEMADEADPVKKEAIANEPDRKHGWKETERRNQLRRNLLSQLIPSLPDQQMVGNLLTASYQPGIPYLPD